MKKILKRIVPWINMSEKIWKKYSKSHRFFNKGLTYLSKLYEYKIYRKYHCCISPGAKIDETVKFPHPVGVVIGGGAIIGANTTIYHNVTIGRKNKDTSEYPIIGDNVVIYANSVIVGNIKIGDNAVIGCNSVVLRDVKEGEVVHGIVK